MSETPMLSVDRERSAIDTIQKSLQILLNGSIKYERQPKEDWAAKRQYYIESLKHYEDFRRNCLESFQIYIDELNVELKPDEDVFYISTKVQPPKGEKEEEEKKEEVRWSNDFDTFKELYEYIENTYLEGAPYQKKRERLFNQLFDEIGQALRETRIAVGNLKFGNPKLEILPQLISLDDPDIQALLPYLLTAYTFNSCDSKFFSPNKNLLQILLGKEETSTIEAPKQRKRIENFSNIFSLKKIQNPKDGNPRLICNKRDDYPCVEEVFKQKINEIKLQNIVALKYRWILNLVFRKWCKIVIDVAKKMDIKDIENTVNIHQCTDLYNYYTMQEIEVNLPL